MEILAADYHRNGIAGRGFHIAIIEDPDLGHGGVVSGRFLYIDFDWNPDEEWGGNVAVVNLDQAAAGNIYMFAEHDDDGEVIPGTGGNAWRGDAFHSTLSKLVSDEVDRRREREHGE